MQQEITQAQQVLATTAERTAPRDHDDDDAADQAGKTTKTAHDATTTSRHDVLEHHLGADEHRAQGLHDHLDDLASTTLGLGCGPAGQAERRA